VWNISSATGARRKGKLWDLELEVPVETAQSLVVPAAEAVLKLNAPVRLGRARAGH
jgi:hypothetical protein